MKSCLLLLPLALAACMAVPASVTHASPAAPVHASAPVAASALSHYHWQLHDAVDAGNQRLDTLFGTAGTPPLQLDFSADQLVVRHACNQLSSHYQIVDGHLLTKQLHQTMMLCANHTMMQRETTIKAMLHDQPTLILSTADNTPQLTLTAADGQTLTFTGKAD